jgi:AraC-like DNA-binding protein
MSQIAQSEALDNTVLGANERSHFFVARRFDNIECLSATFTEHVYAPHSHETYAIGTVLSGCENWTLQGVRHYSPAGSVIAVNPLAVHDARSHDGHYTYRMVYPTIDLMADVVESLSGKRTGTPLFYEPMDHDPEGSSLFAAAHAAVESANDNLLGEELLLRALGRSLVRFARIAPNGEQRLTHGIALVKSLFDAEPAEDYSLQSLARVAGVSSHHLIRAFRQTYGLTPHAYLINQRIERAKAKLRKGERPVDVAATLGFSDQAHLTRAFKARLGTTPAAYRAAFH